MGEGLERGWGPVAERAFLLVEGVRAGGSLFFFNTFSFFWACFLWMDAIDAARAADTGTLEFRSGADLGWLVGSGLLSWMACGK